MLAGICELMQNTTVAKSCHLFPVVQPILSESCSSSYVMYIIFRKQTWNFVFFNQEISMGDNDGG